MPISQAQLLTFAPKGNPDILDCIIAHADVLDRYAINTPHRLQHFFAHTFVESMGFTKLEENLNYSAKRLTQVWPNRFPSLTEAQKYAGDPQALANKVYGGRLGNTAPDDGWRYRGQGLLQTTGKSNVGRLAAHMQVTLDEARGMLTAPDGMLECAAANFVFNGALPFADHDDIVGSTKAVNGGLNGLDERKAALARAKKIFV